MRDNSKLYFDIWRKANFKHLLRAYVKAYELYGRDNIKEGFGKQLDEFVPGGRGTYDGSNKDWYSAYTISRELAIYKETASSFELSNLAKEFMESKITSANYIANYLLNFNQSIKGQVVHPFKKVLDLFDSQASAITKNQISNIPEFRLSTATDANKRQMVNILCNRIADSGLLITSGSRGSYLSLGSYSIEDLKKSCQIWGGTVDQFISMDQNGYVDMICFENPLINRRG